MKLTGALLIVAICSGCANTPEVELWNPRVIHASVAQRQQWVVDQARGPSAAMFSRDYEWILGSKAIGQKEAWLLAHLFFYSTGVMGGSFDDGVNEGDRFRFRFQSELGPVEGKPVFVDSRDGSAWQEGQIERVDMLSLIRLFKTARLDQSQTPNKAPEPTPGPVTSRADWLYEMSSSRKARLAPGPVVAHL